jgi:hypothetical protein
MSAQINSNCLNRIKEIKSKILSEMKATKEKVEIFQSSKKNVYYIYSKYFYIQIENC